jgi:hypothetical protein
LKVRGTQRRVGPSRLQKQARDALLFQCAVDAVTGFKKFEKGKKK